MIARAVLASSNAGKLAELRELLADDVREWIGQGELGIADADETGLSFVENALIKARHAAKISGLPALGDDSGLLVDALGGAPGLHSARYAGVHGDSVANNTLLLQRLAGVPAPQRSAHFYCVLVFLRHSTDPQPILAEGIWHGYILEAPRGERGFGYDPLFFDPLQQCAAAELDPALKNRISHRGQALARLRERLHARPC